MAMIIASKKRSNAIKKHMREISTAVRLLAEMQNTDDIRRITRILKFIQKRSQTVYSLVSQTCESWENKNYWVKADEYRRKWLWTEKLADDIGLLLNERQFSANEISSVLVRYLDEINHYSPYKKPGRLGL